MANIFPTKTYYQRSERNLFVISAANIIKIKIREMFTRVFRTKFKVEILFKSYIYSTH